MEQPRRIYELLLDYCSSEQTADNIVIGLVWTLCQGGTANGLAMSPQTQTRILPWPGELQDQDLKTLAAKILDWDPYLASVAMAAINCCLNARQLPNSITLEALPGAGNLVVFDYFLSQLQDKKVVVIGRYPGLERYQRRLQLTVLEQHPGAEDLPAAASEYILADADWVFLTASSIPNKTFPRLAELARQAKTVLMGPSTPWLPQLHEFGIDYIAGVEVVDPTLLYHTVAQGGGVRIFQQAIRYRVADLTPSNSMAWLKQQISACATDKALLTEQMQQWYNAGNHLRFPAYTALEHTNQRLSQLDSSYKALWDQYGQPSA